MNTEIIKPNLDDAVTQGVVELLLSPEYGGDWIRELLINAGVEEPTEAQEATVANAIDRVLDQLAIPFVETIADEKDREACRGILKKREAALYPEVAAPAEFEIGA